MSDENVHTAQMLMGLKAKAHRGVPWTDNEQSTVADCLRKEGTIGVLGACCVLSSGRPQECSRALSVLCEAISGKHPPPYVELLVYEALIAVDVQDLQPSMGSILEFVGRTLVRRSVDLDNTIVLLGNFARAGHTRALDLLRKLSEDADSGVRQNAILVLRGMPQR